MLLPAVLFAMASLNGDPPAAFDLAPISVEGQAFVHVLGARVPASSPPVVRYRVVVERGLEADAEAFTRTVERVLDDPQGWAGAGRALVRVERAPHFTILLASPATTDRLCAPLQTGGQLSCGRRGRAVLNVTRWHEGSTHWGDDLDGYREYMINHEVGHLLGQPHRPCAGVGESAPVMLQQTKGLQGCAPRGRPSATELERLRRRWSDARSIGAPNQ